MNGQKVKRQSKLCFKSSRNELYVFCLLSPAGYFNRCCNRRGHKPIFNIGNFLNSHKGFDRLSTEDDDHDIDNALDDSDNEEFSITRKA